MRFILSHWLRLHHAISVRTRFCHFKLVYYDLKQKKENVAECQQASKNGHFPLYSDLLRPSMYLTTVKLGYICKCSGPAKSLAYISELHIYGSVSKVVYHPHVVFSNLNISFCDF